MRVFITGASGHIASALIPELRRAGHEVLGLARSAGSADRLGAAGIGIVRGDLTDVAVLQRAARDADAVIHLAFPNDVMRSGGLMTAAAVDLAAARALGEALEPGKVFVGVQGLLALGSLGRVATEKDTAPRGPRVDTENYIIGLAGRGVRSSVVRLSPVTHSAALGRAGFATALIAAARRAGVSAYVGDGANRWPAVHTSDAAQLLRLALEKAPAGARLHAVAEEGITIAAIATAIGRRLGLPVESISAQSADEHFGFLGQMIQLDAPASSALTRGLLAWKPTGPGILTELADPRLYAG